MRGYLVKASAPERSAVDPYLYVNGIDIEGPECASSLLSRDGASALAAEPTDNAVAVHTIIRSRHSLRQILLGGPALAPRHAREQGGRRFEQDRNKWEGRADISALTGLGHTRRRQ